MTTATPQLELPRVTEVLASAGLIDTQWLTDYGRDRGSAVHKTCQYLDEDDLDEKSIDPAIAGYVDAYRRFRKDSPVKSWQWVECPQTDPLRLYRGTPDRIADVRPKALYDIKTGCPIPATALQLAAYVNMLPDPYSYRRFGLYLKPGGSYSVVEFPRSDYARDLAMFQAALTLYYWRKEHHV